jgi:hypothetical protein
MSVAQAAATLAATVIGFDIGLYGSDVVNAVMVVVAVSLILTSIGTNRFAPEIPPPVDERRRAGETILVPVLGELDGLADVLRLGRDLADPAGGIVQPLVPVTSPNRRRHPRAAGPSRPRSTGCCASSVATRRPCCGVDRSVSTGLHQAAIETDASLLLLGWPGPDDLRARMVGATYGEIIAATSFPSPSRRCTRAPTEGRVVLYSAARELVPGNLPTMALALELASTLCRQREQELIIGPVAPSELEAAGLTVPQTAEHETATTISRRGWPRSPARGISSWCPSTTRPSARPRSGSTARDDRCSPSARTPRRRRHRW